MATPDFTQNTVGPPKNIKAGSGSTDLLEQQRRASFLGLDSTQAGAMITTTSATPSRVELSLAMTRDSGLPGTGQNKTTLAEWLSSYNTMDNAARASMQQALFDAHLYPEVYYNPKLADYRKPDFKGDPLDPGGSAAFKNASILSINSQKPFDALIKERTSAYADEAKPAGAAGPQVLAGGLVGGGNVYSTQASDPASLRALADKVATAVLGHSPGKDEQAKIVDTITAHQRSQDVAKNNAAENASLAQFGASVNANQMKAGAELGIKNGAAGDTGAATPSPPTLGGNGGPADLNAFMNALGSQESGDPNATNKSSGAHGAWQIMPANWSSWAKQAGLAGNAPQTMDNQRTVVGHKLTEYFNATHDWRKVASLWYSGGQNDQSTKPQPGGPSIKGYVDSVMSKMSKGATFGGGAGGIVNVPNTYLPSTTVNQTQVDPTAQTQEMLRAAHPAEAGATDLANVYDTFAQMLKGVGGLGAAVNNTPQY